MNKLSLVLLLIIFSMVSFAKDKMKTLTFEIEGFHYKLVLTKDKIRMKGYMIDLSIQRQKCNKDLLISFNRHFDKLSRNLVINKKKSYKVTFKDKVQYIDKSSSFGKFLYALPNRFKGLKKKEQLLCQ